MALAQLFEPFIPHKNPPTCWRCHNLPCLKKHTGVGNRPFYVCSYGHGDNGKVFFWDDLIGINERNPRCDCRLPMRWTAFRGKPGGFFACALKRCYKSETTDGPMCNNGEGYEEPDGRPGQDLEDPEDEVARIKREIDLDGIEDVFRSRPMSVNRQSPEIVEISDTEDVVELIPAPHAQQEEPRIKREPVGSRSPPLCPRDGHPAATPSDYTSPPWGVGLQSSQASDSDVFTDAAQSQPAPQAVPSSCPNCSHPIPQPPRTPSRRSGRISNPPSQTRHLAQTPSTPRAHPTPHRGGVVSGRVLRSGRTATPSSSFSVRQRMENVVLDSPIPIRFERRRETTPTRSGARQRNEGPICLD